MIPLTILSHNPSKTVGLAEGPNPKSDFIGIFSPVFLREWTEQIIEHFGDSKPVHIAAHKSKLTSAMSLVASDSEGDTLQVIVTGYEMEEV